MPWSRSLWRRRGTGGARFFILYFYFAIFHWRENILSLFLLQSLSAGGGRFFILIFLKRWHLNSWNLYTVFILTMLNWQLHESIVKNNIVTLGWPGSTGGTCIYEWFVPLHMARAYGIISAVSHQYPAVAAWTPEDILGMMSVWENLHHHHCADRYKQTCSCCSLLHCLPVIFN